jgi:hypothetical protein
VPCTVDTIPVWLIDTPGFDDTYRSEIEVLREVANWLNAACRTNIELAGIIYLHRITATCMGHSASQNFRMFKKLCGEDCLGSVVLATTMWGQRKDIAAEKREKELQDDPKFWKPMIQHSSKVFRHDSARKSAATIVKHLVQKKRPVILDIHREMIDKKMKLLNTGAGAEVATEAETRNDAWAKELEVIRKEIREAAEKHDTQTKEEMAKAMAEVPAKMTEQQSYLKNLQADENELQREMSAKYEQRYLALTDLLEEKDRYLEGVRSEANHLQQLTTQKLELEKLKRRIRKQNQILQSKCIVM